MSRNDSRWIGDLNAAAAETQSMAAAGKPKGKGRPQREQDKSISPGHWSRIRTDAIRFAGDARLASELSRLSTFLNELTNAQAAAGLRLADIYGRYERVMGLRRSARSASYDAGHGDPGLAEERMTSEQLAAFEARVATIKGDFQHLQEGLLRALDRKALSLVEEVAVEDRMCPSFQIPALAAALDQVANVFGTKWRQRKPGPGKAARPIKPAAQADRKAPAAAPTPDELSFHAELKDLRPDLSDNDLEEAWKRHRMRSTAFAYRDRFRREKAPT